MILLACHAMSENAENPAPAEDLLALFLGCTPEEEPARLSLLLSHQAEPLIDEILNYKIRRYASFRDDAEDLRNEILVALLSRLRKMRESQDSSQIRNFKDYVAVTAYNACSGYFRRRSPLRRSMRNRLRYILESDADFALWTRGSEWLCGQSRWKDRYDSCPREKIPNLSLQQPGMERDVLRQLFRTVNAPVLLEDLLEVFSPSWQTKDVAVEDVDTSLQAQNQMDAVLVQRSFLERAWTEICGLPVKQRAALLLSLRDENGDGMLVVLPATGIASLRKIAEALDMQAEELAGLWKGLPLDDLRIASLLGITRQQVINLRKSARDRLGRRIQWFSK